MVCTIHRLFCLLQNQMARLAFSIVTEAEEDQICFIAATEYEHNMWCDGLNVLLGNEVSLLCYSLLLFSQIEKEIHTDKDVLVCGNTHMHACKNPCMYTHMHTHSHMHMRACTHTPSHTYTRTCTRAHTHTHTHSEGISSMKYVAIQQAKIIDMIQLKLNPRKTRILVSIIISACRQQK